MKITSKARFRALILLSAAMAFTAALAAEPTTKPLDESSKDGAEARKQYLDAITKLRKDFEDRAEPIRAQYIKRLEAAMVTETRRGNLDGALSIREELKLQKRPTTVPDLGSGPIQLVGKWHVRMASGYECDYLISPKLVQQLTEGNSVVPTIEGQHIISRWQNGNVDRYTFAAGRIIVEYWDPKKKPFQDPPNSIGIGVPAE